MQIFVRSLSGRNEAFNVDGKESVRELRKKIAEKLEIPLDYLNIHYSGKVLENRRLLKDYGICEDSTIHVIRERSRIPADPYSIPHETTFDPLQSESISHAWKYKARVGNFDDDLCIVDPEAHYNNMENLEEHVISMSEYKLCRGRYVLDDDLHQQRLTNPHVSSTVPSWLQTYSRSFAPESSSMPPDLDSSSSERLKLLGSMWISYSILCTVMTSFSFLENAEFSKSGFFSVLVEREANIAEIVKIVPSLQLNKIKIDLENLFGHIMEGGTLIGFEKYVTDLMEEPCLNFLEGMGLELPKTTRSVTAILDILRITVLFSDLALVSYTGSHGSKFHERFEVDSNQISVIDQSSGLGFNCALKRFACLDGFLDSNPVWIFKFFYGPRQEQPVQQLPANGMQLLTKIDAFADLWGPVWSIPAKDNKHGIKQYNISKGVICPISDKRKPRSDSAIGCHWYTWAAFKRQRLSRLFKTVEEKILAPNDLLLIGGLHENDRCGYALADFEKNFEADIDVMGTSPEAWRLDTRSAGLNFSKIVGVSVTGTQKRLPQTTLKQLILDKWSNSPKRANPGVLNQYLGVEISHCTGNARRVPLKSLLLMDSVQPLLERQIPGWKVTGWGTPFLAALSDLDPEAIFRVWTSYVSAREKIAELVCCVLELLDTTGYLNDRFTAGLFLDNQELSVKLDHKADSWSMILRDSHLMAVFPIVNGKCLEFHTPDHSTATCTTHALPTVLHTEIATDSSEAFRRIVLKPYHQSLRKMDDCCDQTNIFSVENSLKVILSSLSLSLLRRSVAGKERRTQQMNSSSPDFYIRGSAADSRRSTLRTKLDNIRTTRGQEPMPNSSSNGRLPPVADILTASTNQDAPIAEVVNISQERGRQAEQRNNGEVVNTSQEHGRQAERRNNRALDTDQLWDRRAHDIANEIAVHQMLEEDFNEARRALQVPIMAEENRHSLLNDIGAYQLSDNENDLLDGLPNTSDALSLQHARLIVNTPAAPSQALPRAMERRHEMVDNIDEYYISDHDFDEA